MKTPDAATSERPTIPTILLTQANIRALLFGYKVVTHDAILAVRRV